MTKAGLGLGRGRSWGWGEAGVGGSERRGSCEGNICGRRSGLREEQRVNVGDINIKEMPEFIESILLILLLLLLF